MSKIAKVQTLLIGEAENTQVHVKEATPSVVQMNEWPKLGRRQERSNVDYWVLLAAAQSEATLTVRLEELGSRSLSRRG